MNVRRLAVAVACGLLVTSGCSSGSPSTVSVTNSIETAVTEVAEQSTDESNVNVWVGPPTDITQLPIGTSLVSLTDAQVGGLFACDAGNPNGGGAGAAGPWLNEAEGTWDLSRKIAVSGEVSWPMASYSEVIDGDRRVITSNGVPVGEVTGVFPIAADDPAFAFDRNPNSIAAYDVTISLPASPTRNPAPTCLGKGSVGVLKNGVALYAPLDEGNRDAVAYETQDQCDGHPQQASVYHYHAIPSCVVEAATESSTVVGFAYDGFPIVVERDASGNLPTNADLDECHGRTSLITLDDVAIETYHYSATYEFPYFIGCFAGTPVP